MLKCCREILLQTFAGEPWKGGSAASVVWQSDWERSLSHREHQVMVGTGGSAVQRLLCAIREIPRQVNVNTWHSSRWQWSE